jgi:tRNA(Ile)-lysidine synthase TilS/MesJ
MKVCARCVLPESFPGIQFNEEGICHFCRDFDPERLMARKAEYRRRFEGLVKEHAGKSEYDAILSYSGGKDSTFTLLTLRHEYQLNVLAFTMDNGFLSKRAVRNIREVTGRLGVDHLFFKPRFDVLRIIFSECARRNIFPPKTLQRASPVCTACMSIIRFRVLRIAIEEKIPFAAYGWSPGQAPLASSILKNNAALAGLMQKSTLEPLRNLVGDAVTPYFLSPGHLTAGHDLPYNIHPLAFLDYSEDSIFEAIEKIGWRPPQDTDVHSTNCLLNAFANVIHKKQFGFHPYAFEMASLVRQGYIERSTALARLQEEERPELVDGIRTMLGLSG